MARTQCPKVSAAFLRMGTGLTLKIGSLLERLEDPTAEDRDSVAPC